jgi:hypothetical protein
MLSRLKYLKVFLTDTNKKSKLKIAREVILFAIIKKSIPTDYFRKYLYRNNVINYKNYLSLKEYYSIIGSNRIVFPEISSILKNKLSFHNYCKNSKLPTPTLLSYNFKKHWFHNNKIIIVHSKKDVLLFFQNIFANSNLDALFLKPVLGQGGAGCILLKKNNLNSKIEEYYNLLVTNSYVHQIHIKQHIALNKVYHKSVNTIRIDTYIDKNNVVHILSAMVRFGIGNAFTDNTHTGGFYVSLNLNSGKLQGVGRQDIIMGGKEVLYHPDSKIILDGFQIPFYREALQLAKKAAKKLPNRIIGWDVAITNNGPILIEGNESPSLHVTDVAYGGYLNNEHIKSILLEIKK